MRVKEITEENFATYGHIIEYPLNERQNPEDNLFKIVIAQAASTGWRIAYLVLRDKAIDRLEQHPDSYESFEPVRGRTFLFVAHAQQPLTIECFCLDKPVILKKGIWHGVVTLEGESELKITENAQVECIYQSLETPLAAPHGWCPRT